MIAKSFSGVKVGDFIRLCGHRINPAYTDRWHKVTDTDSGQLTFVDRNGRERHWRYGAGDNVKFLVWEPGDPRTDNA